MELQNDFVGHEAMSTLRSVADHGGASINPWQSALDPTPSVLQLQELPAWDDATSLAVCVTLPKSVSELHALVASHVTCSGAVGTGMATPARPLCGSWNSLVIAGHPGTMCH